MNIEVVINGDLYHIDIEENKTLLHLLRENLGLTGTKEGCGAGECGACTVLFNGRAVNACMVLAVEANGCIIDTIEGEAKNGELSKIQKAFDKNHAVQCGYCSAGMVMSVRELIQNNPKPSIEEIKHSIEGNFCRCTGYVQIIEAILDLTGQSCHKEE